MLLDLILTILRGVLKMQNRKSQSYKLQLMTAGSSAAHALFKVKI